MELTRQKNSDLSFSKYLVHPLALIFSLLVFLFSFGFFFYRTQFGVDFMDEAYYSGLALRLYLGQKLFVDDLALGQTFSLIIYPFFSSYMWASHSMEGVILFLRNANALLYLGLSFLIYSSLRKTLDRSLVIIVAATTCLYFPGNIETLSYNTLGTFFLSVSLFCLFNAVEKSKSGLYFWAGLSLGLSAISYITFCALVGFLIIYLFILGPSKKHSLFFAAGALIPISALGIYSLFHFSDLLNNLSFSKEYAYSVNWKKALFVTHKFLPKTVILVGSTFLGVSFYIRKTRPVFFFWVIVAVPFLATLLCELSYAHWYSFPVYLSVLSLIVFLKNRPDKRQINLLKWIFIPSFVAGLISAMSSASGHLNFQVGAIPASFIALIFLAQGLKNASDQDNSFLKQTSILVTLAAPVFLMFLYPLNIWNDSPFSELTEKITVGPWKGIHTAPEKKKIAELTYLELKPLLNVKGPLLIYPNFCTGYLVSPVPPAKGVIWYQNSGRVNEILADLYKQQINPDSRVIRMKVWYGTPTVKAIHSFDLNDPLNRLIETTHHPIKDTEWFTVFAPNRK